LTLDGYVTEVKTFDLISDVQLDVDLQPSAPPKAAASATGDDPSATRPRGTRTASGEGRPRERKDAEPSEKPKAKPKSGGSIDSTVDPFKEP
jgi:hypothetical protein